MEYLREDLIKMIEKTMRDLKVENPRASAKQTFEVSKYIGGTITDVIEGQYKIVKKCDLVTKMYPDAVDLLDGYVRINSGKYEIGKDE